MPEHWEDQYDTAKRQFSCSYVGRRRYWKGSRYPDKMGLIFFQ